jgi:hypothetical protein
MSSLPCQRSGLWVLKTKISQTTSNATVLIMTAIYALLCFTEKVLRLPVPCT